MSEFLSTAQIAERYGVAQRTVTEKWTKRPDFPKPAQVISRRTVRWRAADVERWAQRRAGERETEDMQEFPFAEFLAEAMMLHIRTRAALIEAGMQSLHRARKRALKAGMAIEVESRDVPVLLRRQDFRCAVSGREFTLVAPEGAKARPFAPSLDRIDSRRGYELDNVRFVCTAVNMLMNEWGDSVFGEFFGQAA